MNSKLWLADSFTTFNLPDWICPTCNKGVLALNKEQFIHHETAISLIGRTDDNWEPEWIRYRFSGFLTCSNPKCNDQISVSGTGANVELQYYDERDSRWTSEWRNEYSPTCFIPPLRLIVCPAECPEEIKSKLTDSFSLFWSDLASCANKLRVVLELIMNQQKVRKTTTNKKGKRVTLTLHGRITEFKKVRPEIADYLFAIKWIGNSGSHLEELKKPDVLDAYELIEHSLEKLYSRKEAELQKKTREINKKKGPRSKVNKGKPPF